MFRSKKLALICVLMIVTGLMLSAVGYLLGGRVWGIGLNQSGIWVNSPNITGGEGCHYVKETKELDAFTGIDADIDFGDLIIELSDHYGISYNVPEDCRFDVTVEDGVLKVVKKNREGLGIQNNYVAMGSSIMGNRRENAYVKISIPAGLEFDTVRLVNECGAVTAAEFWAKSLTVEADFGNVELKQVSGGAAQIFLESGKLTLTGAAQDSLAIRNQFGAAVLSDVSAQTAEITMESGDFLAEASDLGELVLVQGFGEVRLADVSLADTSITNESGMIRFDDVTAGELEVKSSFGDVDGERVTARSGSMEVESGTCTLRALDIPVLAIESDFGDVNLELIGAAEEYTYDLATEFGNVEVDRRGMGSTYRSLETHKKSLTVSCESGSIRISGGGKN